ncbi:MAG TPA: hypothetical protein VG028_16965, partial [Terriglobia bacterium]|nr:hypothetical protein [Terriglobia bacterium]
VDTSGRAYLKLSRGEASGNGSADLLLGNQNQWQVGTDFEQNGSNDFFVYRSGATPFIFINSSGNVGIGTSSPGYKLEIVDTSGRAYLKLSRGEASGNGSADLLLGNQNQWQVGTDFEQNGSNDFFVYRSGATPFMFINSSGNVGIGNTNPLASLDITGGMNASGSAVLGGTATKQSPTSHGPEKLSIQDADALKVGIAAFVGSEVNARFLLDMNGNHEWSNDGSDQTVVLGCTAIGRMNLVGFPMGSSARGGLGIVAWKWSVLTSMVDNIQTTFPVQNATPFTGVMKVRVENEICTLNSIVGNTLNVTRGTNATSHSAGASVVAIGMEEPQPRLLFVNDGGGIYFGDGTGYPDISISRPFNSVLNATATLKLRPTSSFTASGTVSISSMTPTVVTGDANTGTLFTKQVHVGDNIQVSGQTRTVTAVSSDSSLTVGMPFTVTGMGLFMAVLSFDASGTVSFSNSAMVTGTNTRFTTEIGLGDRITIGTQTQTVVAIASDTSLTVGTPFTGMASNQLMSVLPSIFRADDTSGTPRLIVSDQGKVGIGTAAPQALLDVAGQARVQPVTVATLPTASAALQGAVACVTDATAFTYYNAVVGGGANVVMVFCDGTSWRIF